MSSPTVYMHLRNDSRSVWYGVW